MPSLRVVKTAFIVSFDLIGHWDFDDGPTDSGYADIIDDKSSVDNKGILVNFPTWIKNPHCIEGGLGG